MSNDFDAIETGPKVGSFSSYATGLILSLVFTLTAYFIVDRQLLSKGYALLAIASLALLQMISQLIFFLHMRGESPPRWNVLSFLFMGMVSFILVLGTLWIMYSLDENVMPVENPDLMHHPNTTRSVTSHD